MSSDLFQLGSLFDSGDDYSGDDESGDIVGAMYDSGDDDVGDIVGALVGALKRRRAAPPQRRRPQLPPRGYNPASPVVDYKPFNPTKTRRYGMGFSGTLLAAATGPISSQAQLPFRPERVVIPDTIGANFLVNDLKIGVKSQFVGTGAMPALTFAQNAIDTTLGLDTASISQTITFNVTNTDAANAHLFAASLIGTTMDN